MNQGTFPHTEDPIELPISATQTGTHILVVDLPGMATKRSTFSASSGSAFSVPNIFGELGSFTFRIIQPDETEVSDGSGCKMSLNIELVSC